MSNETNDMKETILRITGTDPKKCMRCGKCSAACPSYDEMEYHPHQFVYMIELGEIDRLTESSSMYRCLSCFACLERCPRQVEPAKLIEAVRTLCMRRQGMNHLTPNDIPGRSTDADLPVQAIVSANRKFSK